MRHVQLPPVRRHLAAKTVWRIGDSSPRAATAARARFAAASAAVHARGHDARPRKAQVLAALAATAASLVGVTEFASLTRVIGTTPARVTVACLCSSALHAHTHAGCERRDADRRNRQPNGAGCLDHPARPHGVHHVPAGSWPQRDEGGARQRPPARPHQRGRVRVRRLAHAYVASPAVVAARLPRLAAANCLQVRDARHVGHLQEQHPRSLERGEGKHCRDGPPY